MNFSKYLGIGFLLVVLAVAGGGVWFVFKGDGSANDKDIPENLITTAKLRDIETKLLLTGEIAPGFMVDIKSEISGRVKEIHARTGSFVDRGTPLLTIDDVELLTERKAAETEVRGAELEVEKRRGNFERAKALFEEKLISKEVFANLESDLLIAENSLVRSLSRLQTVDDKLNQTRILAPASGTVLNIMVNEGQVVVGATSVNSGTVLMSFADLGRLVVDTHVNQMDIGKINIGDSIKILMQGEEGKAIPARVEFVAPVATVRNNIKGFAVQAVVEELDPGLRPGMSLSLEVPIAKSKKTVSVPISAVFTEQDEKVVYVRSGAGTQRRPVRIGVSNFSFAEVLEGLNEGEEILLVQPTEFASRG
jgi:RND family efflux transporter MFP subunit